KGVNFEMLPYAKLGEKKNFFPERKIKTYDQAMKCFLKHMTEQLDPNKTNILVGHLTVSGGIKSDSESELSIGTVEERPENVMKQFDSVLLGHLHHPFRIQSDFVHYSGSLLKYSF
ncbi:metallophosphoesterase family protein, partial [Staphylococcus simulans]